MLKPNLKTKSIARKLQVFFLAFLLIFAVSCEKDETVMPADPQADENGEMTIDEVLEAYSEGTDEVEGDENARRGHYKKRPTFRTLIVALAKTNLIREVSMNPTTVFAPTDKAFAELGLYPWNIDEVPNLNNILLYHVVGEKVFSDQ